MRDPQEDTKRRSNQQNGTAPAGVDIGPDGIALAVDLIKPTDEGESWGGWLGDWLRAFADGLGNGLSDD